jgi:hypothetical protein
MSTYEKKIINDVEVHHTFRGHEGEVEAYSVQIGPKTYSLYKLKGGRAWQCDWMTAHHWEDIQLDADPTDLEAMLDAFTQMLHSRR